jgi:hypothetical protein
MIAAVLANPHPLAPRAPSPVATGESWGGGRHDPLEGR